MREKFYTQRDHDLNTLEISDQNDDRLVEFRIAHESVYLDYKQVEQIVRLISYLKGN